MNIEEVKQLRKNLEKDIFELVSKFESDTNLNVDNINLDYLEFYTIRSKQEEVKQLTGISIEVRL